MAQIRIAQALLELATNTAKFTSDLGQALTAAEKFKSKAEKALGALAIGFSVKEFAGFIKGAIDSADKLNDLRTRTGATGQELLVMQGAAKRSGVEMEAVGEIATKLTKRMVEASRGTGEGANGWKALGISVEDGSGKLKGVNQILLEAGAKFKGYEDGADKAAIANAAFGKGGDRLIPMVEALEETRKRFEELGITIDEQTLTKADKFNDTIDDIKDILGNVATRIAAALLPTLQDLADVFVDNAKDAQTLSEGAGALATTLKLLASGAIIVGTVFKVAGKAIAAIAAAAVQVAEGNFRTAWEILNVDQDDAIASAKKAMSDLEKVWSAGGERVEKAAEKVKKTRAPKLPDLEGAKKANEALNKLEQQRTKLSLEALKDENQKRESLLDRAHSENLISDQGYYTQRLELARNTFDAEVGLLDQQIARQQGLVNSQKQGTKEYYDAVGNLEETLAKRNGLERDFKQYAANNYLDAQQAAKQYKDTVENLNIQLLELQGNTVEATKKRLALQNRDLREKFSINGDTAALNTLDTTEKLTIAQSQFNKEREQMDLINGNLQVSEDRIQNSLKTGAISELEALSRTGKARQDAVALLQTHQAMIRKVAEETGNPKLLLEAEQLQVQIEKLAAESHLLEDKFNSLAASAFSEEISNWLDGTKSLTEAFKDMEKTFVKAVTKMASEAVAQQLFGGGSSGGGIGGLFANIFGGGRGKTANNSWMGAEGTGAFDMGGVTGSQGGGGGWMSMLGSFFGGFFADGGMTMGGKPIIVGERGPEMLIPKGVSDIVPMRKGGAGDGSMHVSQTFVLSGPTDRRSQAQIASAAENGLMRGRRIR